MKDIMGMLLVDNERKWDWMIMPIIARIELIIIYKYEIVALSERKRKRYAW